MADWIPVRKDLKNELEVLRISALTGLGRMATIGCLIDFWCWCDTVTSSGIIKGVKLDEMSLVCPDVPGTFWAALCDVGWLRISAEFIEIPNYDVWLGRSAKKRLKEQRKKRQQRNAEPNVPFLSRSQRDKKGTTEQDTTEQQNPLSPFSDSHELRAAWDDWLTYHAQLGRRLAPKTLDEQIARLGTLGPARGVAAIRHSIASGYKGLFEPRPGDVDSGPAPETTAERLARREREKAQRVAATESEALPPRQIRARIRKAMKEAAPRDSDGETDHESP